MHLHRGVGAASVLLLAAFVGGAALLALRPMETAGPRLVIPGQMDGVTQRIRADLYPQIVIGSMTVCLDRPGAVRVTSVKPTGGTLDVTGWAFRPNPFLHGGEMIGDQPGALMDAGLAPEMPRNLTIVCNRPSGNSYELLVQLRAQAQSTASVGFTIRYEEASGGTRELAIPFRVIMCQRKADPICHV